MRQSDWSRSWRPWLRGTAIGFPLGSLPTGGAEIPTFLSYGVERRLSRHRSDFGRGAIEGVAGPEAANNAAAAGALVPLLALGVYAVNRSAVDLVVLYAIGALGLLMRRFGLPVAPAIIGVILGPLAEQQLRRALAIGQGDPSVLVTSPIAAVLLSMALLALTIPAITRWSQRRRQADRPPPRRPGDRGDGPGGPRGPRGPGGAGGAGGAGGFGAGGTSGGPR